MVVILVLAAWVSGCGSDSTLPADSAQDPSNNLPFGVMDIPTNNGTVGRVVECAGWALDDTPVRVVRLFVDGRYHGAATPNFARPDLLNVFPKYMPANPTPGWKTTVDLGESPGAHTILAQAVDDRGATRDIGFVTVNLIGRQ
jgi:hypothetical protein